MKLPRLQLHLSTCIVLMFAAGGLVWANVREHSLPVKELPLAEYTTTNLPDYFVIASGIGWPRPFWYAGTGWGPFWDWPRFAFNLATALAILAAVAFVCEWIIRRRGATKMTNGK